MSNTLVRRRLSDEVRLRLEELIREEVYPVGTSLPSERDLMEMFGVGRPSIREALFALECMGLVRINTGERPRVTRPTPQGMLDALSGTAHLLLDQPGGVRHFEQARQFLEVGLARHAAEAATSAQIGALTEALEKNESVMAKARAFAITDVAFHRVLAEISSNPIFLAMHEALVDWLIGQRPLPANPEVDNRRSFEGHAEVLRAIERRDPDAAGAAMRAHLDNARRKFGGQAPPPAAATTVRNG